MDIIYNIGGSNPVSGRAVTHICIENIRKETCEHTEVEFWASEAEHKHCSTLSIFLNASCHGMQSLFVIGVALSVLNF